MRVMRAPSLRLARPVVANLARLSAFLFAAYALGVRVRWLIFFAIMPVERTIWLCRSVSPELDSRKSFADHAQRALRVPEAKPFSSGRLASSSYSFAVFRALLFTCFISPSGAAERVKISEMEEEVVTLEHELGDRNENVGGTLGSRPSRHKGRSHIRNRPSSVATFAMTADGKVRQKIRRSISLREDKLHWFASAL